MTKAVTMTTRAIRALRVVEAAERALRAEREARLASGMAEPDWGILEEKRVAAIKVAEEELRCWLRSTVAIYRGPPKKQ
jgi:hypothetical protein